MIGSKKSHNVHSTLHIEYSPSTSLIVMSLGLHVPNLYEHTPRVCTYLNFSVWWLSTWCCVCVFRQLRLIWFWTHLWCSRRHILRTVRCTCCTALQRRTVCLKVPRKSTGPTATVACSASPHRSTTLVALTSGLKLDATPGSGTHAMGNYAVWCFGIMGLVGGDHLNTHL